MGRGRREGGEGEGEKRRWGRSGGGGRREGGEHMVFRTHIN